VSYFLAATKWWLAVPSRSVGGSLYAMIADHAPFATAMAALGFLLMPEGFTGPYAVNLLVLAVFLAGCARLIWPLPLTAIAACLVALASVPLLTQVVTEARPDLAWGLAMGLVLVATVHRPLVMRSPWGLFLLGLLAGGAAAIKPTALPASIAYVVATLGIGSLCDVLDEGYRLTRTRVTLALRTAAIYLAGFVLLLAPLVAVQSKTLLNYILATLVYNKDFWRYEGDLYQQATFYFAVLRPALGWWRWIGVGLFAARLALSFRFDRKDFRRAWALLAALIWVYIVPTLSEMKTFFVGGSIYGVFVVAMAVNFASVIGLVDRAVASRGMFPGGRPLITRRFALAATLALAVASLAFELAAGRIRIATVFPKPWIEDTANGTARVWDTLRRSADAATNDEQNRRPVTVTFSSPSPVNPSIIQLYAAKAGMPLDAGAAYFHRTLEAAAQALAASDFSVVTSSMPHNLPGPRMGDDLIRALDADPAVCMIDSFPQASGGIVRVYRNRRLGCPASSNGPRS
jgi:hypothetical protein